MLLFRILCCMLSTYGVGYFGDHISPICNGTTNTTGTSPNSTNTYECDGYSGGFNFINYAVLSPFVRFSVLFLCSWCGDVLHMGITDPEASAGEKRCSYCVLIFYVISYVWEVIVSIVAPWDGEEAVFICYMLAALIPLMLKGKFNAEWSFMSNNAKQLIPFDDF